MRILMASCEFAPLVPGGIGEGVGGLASALCDAGDDVTVALPASAAAHRALGGATERRLADGTEVRVVGGDAADADAPVWGSDLADAASAARYARYVCAVEALALREPFDVVHAHDWPAAMALYRIALSRTTRPRTVLTVHNLAYQGIFDASALAHLNLGPEHVSMDRLEFYGRINFLKGGLVAADAITTVSPTYAREIQGPGQGELLDGVFRARARDLVGIVNGIDARRWDPMTSPALTPTFAMGVAAAKAANKRALATVLGLPDAAPWVVWLGRLVPQKGPDILAACMADLMRRGACVLIAGRGDPPLEEAIADAVAPWPDRARALGFVDDTRAEQLLAAADIVVMPSRYEPCGIVQLQAQRYGALPVACRTGGLTDTIADTGDPASLTGVLIDEATPAALDAGIARALAWRGHPAWPALQERLTRLPVRWVDVAPRYRALYDALLAGRFGRAPTT